MDWVDREIHKDGEVQAAYNGLERDCAACSVQGSLASHCAENEMRIHWVANGSL